MLLVHPGGPFWRNKDAHAWSIPKGLVGDHHDGRGEPAEETPEDTARREFAEETGSPAPAGPLVALDEIDLGSGKRLRAFAAIGEFDPASLASNTFEIEWPPRSGRLAEFPEVDRAEWVPLDDATAKLHKGQARLVDALRTAIAEAGW